MRVKKLATFLWTGLVLLIVAGVIIRTKQFGQDADAPAVVSSNSKISDADFVSYHTEPPKGSLPPTILPAVFKGDAKTRACYRMAGETKALLYQLPCYCRCDKMEGHKSLLDCFTGKHGADCEICKREAAYAYRESRKGSSVEQVRYGIMHGLWRDIDLEEFALLGGQGSKLDSKLHQDRKSAQ
jgi:hypothetical protein